MTDITDNVAAEESVETHSAGEAAVAGENPVTDAVKDQPTPVEQRSAIPDNVIALVQGNAITELPKDLYIPPEALEVFLEAFEGPLDLLLYLIKRQNLDILNIPIAEITRQYMEYVEIMKDIHFELAADYLVMAAMLAEIKSRMLLPRPESDEEDEDDPRAELIRRLQQYERYKKAAEDLNELPRMERDIFRVSADVPELHVRKKHPDVEMRDLMMALKDVLVRAEMNSHHHIQMEPLSVRERMSVILSQVKPDSFLEFKNLFDPKEGRLGVVVTFLAILELVKESLLDLVQAEPYGPIHVTAAGSDRWRSQTNN